MGLGVRPEVLLHFIYCGVGGVVGDRVLVCNTCLPQLMVVVPLVKSPEYWDDRLDVSL